MINAIRFRNTEALVALQVKENPVLPYYEREQPEIWRDAKTEDLLEVARFIPHSDRVIVKYDQPNFESAP